MRAFLVPKDYFHAIFDHFWQNKFSNFSVIFCSKMLIFTVFWCIFEVFFQKNFLVQICLKIIKNTFWRVFEVPKNVFMHFWTILDKVKFWIFQCIFGQKFWKFSIFCVFTKFFQLFFSKCNFCTKSGEKSTKVVFFIFFRP